MTIIFVKVFTPESKKISLNINLNESVSTLKKKLQDKWKHDSKSFNLIHSGCILEDTDCLESAGIKNETLIHCTPKCVATVPAACPLSLVEAQQLMTSLRTAVSNPNFRTLIKKLCLIDQTERLISECPSLRRDPAALAFIQDPDLVYSLLSGNIERFLDERPALGRLLQIICTLVSSEVGSPRRSRHVSYSIDALSDEEMEVELNEGDSASNSRAGGGTSFQPITPAQLAAALANATGNWAGGITPSAPRSGLTTPSSSSTPFNTPAPNSASRAGGASPGGPIITNEMFSQALQNALAASASRSSVPVTSVSQNASQANANPTIDSLEESLQLMREMGIADEQLAVQALQTTDGDVQAAVNLIFAQWMADD